jgi:hypothetical protein
MENGMALDMVGERQLPVYIRSVYILLFLFFGVV